MQKKSTEVIIFFSMLFFLQNNIEINNANKQNVPNYNDYIIKNLKNLKIRCNFVPQLSVIEIRKGKYLIFCVNPVPPVHD